MRSLIAFTKKEFTDHLRTGKIIILAIVFALFGAMNPAIAKVTPWIFEIFSDALAESGMVITVTEVTAIDSWLQFFKNVSTALIVFVIIEGNIFTKEYGVGTLELSLTKGLKRYKVIVAKSTLLAAMWTVCYFIYFALTYAGGAIFWDNSTVDHLMLSVMLWWLFGLWVVSLMVLMSTLSKSMVGVLFGTGGIAFGFYVLNFIPKVSEYFPTMLTNGTSLVYGFVSPKDFVPAVIITVVTAVVCFAVSVPVFNKKQL